MLQTLPDPSARVEIDLESGILVVIPSPRRPRGIAGAACLPWMRARAEAGSSWFRASVSGEGEEILCPYAWIVVGDLVSLYTPGAGLGLARGLEYSRARKCVRGGKRSGRFLRDDGTSGFVARLGEGSRLEGEVSRQLLSVACLSAAR